MRIASFEEREWIDARTDRVPMTDDEVLVSLRKKSGQRDVLKGSYLPENKMWFWGVNGIGEVEAWQPIPDPYYGGEDECE